VDPLYTPAIRDDATEDAIPLYSYQCEDCGLRFDKRASASRAGETVGCGCGEQADRVVPDSVQTTFNPKGDGTIRPQNTGVSSYDANVDRVIGEHSRGSWDSISKRHTRKREVLRENPGKTGWDLGRTLDGDYQLIGADERNAAETARGLHGDALGMIERHKKRKKAADAG
jgi:putative FmdB family regulatory protein